MNYPLVSMAFKALTENANLLFNTFLNKAWLTKLKKYNKNVHYITSNGLISVAFVRLYLPIFQIK